MTNLDEKLKEILHKYAANDVMRLQMEVEDLPALKQLFKEHGWEESDGNS